MLSVTAVADDATGAGRNMRASAPTASSTQTRQGTQIKNRLTQRSQVISEPRPNSTQAAATNSNVVSSSKRRSDGASGSCAAGKASMLRSATKETNANTNTQAATRLALAAGGAAAASRGQSNAAAE